MQLPTKRPLKFKHQVCSISFKFKNYDDDENNDNDYDDHHDDADDDNDDDYYFLSFIFLDCYEETGDREFCRSQRKVFSI